MFQPVLPVGGLVGWRLLERTEAVQRTAFEQSAQVDRDMAHFREKIASVETAEDLVADRTLLRVALGAYGLDEELGKTFFLKKILEEGSESPDALANKFVDPRYRDLAAAFGFGDLLGARTWEPGFADRILDRYKERQFEIAVGNQDPNMRLALGFRREIAEYAGSDLAENTIWLRILGSKPMREVFESAFNLPSEFSTLDVDKQVEVLSSRAQDILGRDGFRAFNDPDVTQRVIDRFLLRKQIEGGPSASTPGAAALSLLQLSGNGLGASARIGLILSGA